MGASQSASLHGAVDSGAAMAQSAGDLHKHLSNVYQASIRTSQAAAGKTGGFFGGAEEDNSKIVADLKGYRESKAAEVKEETVRRIARALKSQGVGNINPEDPDLDRIVSQVKESIPDPAKKKVFDSDAKLHGKACKAIAIALNEQFTPGASASQKLIDTSAGPVYICRRVADLIHSMASGMHTEFLQVQVGIKTSLQDLAALTEFLEALQKQAIKELQEGATSEAQNKAEPFVEAADRLRKEVEISMKKLEGYLHVTLAPAQEELQLLMAEEGELYKRLKANNLVPGTGEFGDALAYALTGLGTLAAVATRTQKSLKEVGLSVQQYTDSSTWRELDELINKKQLDVDVDQLGKFEKARQQLRDTFWRHDQLVEAMDEGIAGKVDYYRKKASKRDDNLDDDADSGEFVGRGEFCGGADAPTELDKRIADRKTTRKLILTQYLDRSRRAYDQLLAAVKKIGPELGKGIPVTTELDAVRDALQRLDRSNIPRLDLSLIGFFTTAAAKSQRETFLGQLRHLRSAVEEAIQSETYRAHSATLAPVRDAIDDLIKTIDYYADIVVKKYGGEQAEQPEVGPAEVDEDGEEVVGGAEIGGTVAEELQIAEQNRSSLDLRSAVNDFLYFFYVARVRENLKITSKEIESYGAKYEEILGDAVAGRVQEIKAEYEAMTDPTQAADNTHLGPRPKEGEETFPGSGFLWAAPVENPPNDTYIAQQNWDAAKASLKTELDTKLSFYNLVQAIDLYMKAFAKASATDPDALLDIKRQLNGVETIGKWFTDVTGDNLVKFFEGTRRVGGTAEETGQVGDIPPNGHYYDAVETALNNSQAVGGGGSVGAAKAEELRSTVGKALTNFQALKNMLNAFVRLGAKFGGTELQRMTFMTPREIYTNLIKFLRVSSVSTGVHTSAPGVWNAPADGQNAVPQATNAPQAARLCYPTPSSAAGGFASDWSTENNFFQFIIKCIAAKTIVVLGIFDLFERPEPLYKLTPTRMILGGSDGLPEVIPAATELYFRLPRLAEFYFELFDFTAGAPQQQQVSMLPELSGVFSGLISQVFVKSAAVAKSGEYSDIETQALISVINQIYDHYRSHGDKCVQKALEDFVAEINRRYAIIKREEWNKMQQLLSETRRFMPQQEDTNNYAILPDEDDVYTDYGTRRMAPSDRFIKPSEGKLELKWAPGKYNLDTSMWDLLSGFREKLSGLLGEAVKRDYGQTSYRSLISQSRREIEKKNGQQEKLEVVYRLIQGSELISGTDQGRALMFHETVVVGLNMLTAIHDQVSAFRTRMRQMDVTAIDAALESWLKDAAAGPANAGDVTRDNIIGNGAGQADLGASARYIRNQAVAAPAGGNGEVNYQLLQSTWPADLVEFGSNQTLADMFIWVGAARGANLANLGADPAAQQQAQQRIIDSGLRFIVDRHQIMHDFIVSLMELTCDFDEVVNVRFPGAANSKLHLDFSKLRDLIEGLVASVRKFMEVFRSSMSASTIERFEGIGANPAKGTLAWVEENLIEGFIRGQRASGGQYVENSPETFEKLAGRVNKIFIDLTKAHKWCPNVQPLAIADPIECDSDTRKYDQYGTVLSGLVFWNALDNRGVPASTPFTPETGKLAPFIAGARQPGAAPGAASPALKSNNNADIDTRSPLYVAGGWTDQRSLMMSFNQTLAMYLMQYYDAPTGKIYQGLLDAFAQGSFSQSVMSPGYSQPDIFVGNLLFGRRGDPSGQSVLLTSLATILQRFVTDNTTQGVSMHLQATLAEVPMYVKEDFRASLPIFGKLFETLNRQGTFLKELIQRGKIQCGRVNLTGVIANNIPAAARGALGNNTYFLSGPLNDVANNDGAMPPPWLDAKYMVPGITMHPLGDGGANTDATVRPHIIDVIDGITRGCYTLSNITQNVLRELADEPLYLQTGAQSITDYQARYNMMPLMPLSLSLFYLNPIEAGAPDMTGTTGNAADPQLMPRQGVGSPQFRLLYGIRGLFSPNRTSNISLSAMPGAKAILDGYNSGSTAREKFEQSTYEQFAQQVVTSLRYLVNTRSYRAQLLPSAETYAGASLFQEVQAGGGVGRMADNLLAYPLKNGRTRTQILEIVDSSFQSEKIKDITADLATVGDTGGQTGTSNRQSERIKSIIDMNIMPINVHALMRSMALSETYNYSYTLEELACLFFGESRTTVKGLNTGAAWGAADAPTTTKQFFLKLLLDPYAEVSMSQYGNEMDARGTAGFVQRLCRGDDNLMMGRPKFISDQLFNKVLFGSLYPARTDYDESGPGGQTSRGRDLWRQGYQDVPAALQALGNMFVALMRVQRDVGTGGGWNSSTAGRLINSAQRVHGIFSNVLNVAEALRGAPPANRPDGNVLMTFLESIYQWALAHYPLVQPNYAPAAPAAGADAAARFAAAFRVRTANNADGGIGNIVRRAGARNGAADAAAIRAILDVDAGGNTPQIYREYLSAILAGNGGANNNANIQELGTIANFDYRVVLMAYGYDDVAVNAAQASVDGAAAAADAIRLVVGECLSKFFKSQDLAAPVAQQIVMTTFKQKNGGQLTINANYEAKILDPTNQVMAGPSNTQVTVTDGTTSLTYIRKLNAGEEGIDAVRAVLVSPGNKARLLAIGKERFDSAIVRNLFFITNIYRVLRQKMSTELAQTRTIIQRGDALITPSLTEYGMDPELSRDEVASSRQYFSERTMLV